MPRVVKHPDIRRGEILDQAFRIFLENGYEKTSLNEVILKAGISKGMFYHYFPSKEVLLMELAHRYADKIFEAFRPCFEVSGLTPLERLQGFFNRYQEIRLERAQATRSIFSSFYLPENSVLYNAIDNQYDELIVPEIARIISDGVGTGQFQTFDSSGVADMIGRLIASHKSAIAMGLGATNVANREVAIAEYQRKLKLHGLATDRMLGLPDGTLMMGTPEYARRFIELSNPLD